MLEEVIKELTQEIQAMRLELTAMRGAYFADNQGAKMLPDAQVEELLEISEPDEIADDIEITQQDLQDKMLEMVRSTGGDKGVTRTKIKSLIKKHGGELIKDVPVENYPALFEELVAL